MASFARCHIHVDMGIHIHEYNLLSDYVIGTIKMSRWRKKYLKFSSAKGGLDAGEMGIKDFE